MWKEALTLALAEDVCVVGHHVGAVVVALLPLLTPKLLTENVVAVAVPPTIINHHAALLSIVVKLIKRRQVSLATCSIAPRQHVAFALSLSLSVLPCARSLFRLEFKTNAGCAYKQQQQQKMLLRRALLLGTATCC